MLSLIAALTFYLAFSPVQPALSVGDYLPKAASSHLAPAPVRAEPLPKAPVKKDPANLGVDTVSRSAIVMDWRSGAILFEKNADAPQSVASISKLVTALVVLAHRPDWNAMVEIVRGDIRGGNIPMIIPGDDVSISDLFNLSLVASDNDATAALARSTGLSDEDFVREMNRLAADVGMTGASFVEPTGLDPRNRATARDIALLVKRAMSEPDISRAVRQHDYSFSVAGGPARRVISTDQLLGSFLTRQPYEFLGGKTGYLDEAGYCFGAAAQNGDGNRVVAVVLGAPGKDDRFREVKSLIHWAFESHDWPPQGTALRRASGG